MTSSERKPDMALIPPKALWAIGQCFTLGSDAHGAEPIDPGGRSVDQEISAALRHITQLNAGIEFDQVSGLPHAVHAASRMMIAAEILLAQRES